MIRNNVKMSAIDGSKVYYYAFEYGRTYDWLVFPGSLDPEHDALVFNSRTEMLAWCRDVLKVGSWLRRQTIRTDGTNERSLFPCVEEDFRKGLAHYRATYCGRTDDGDVWAFGDYVDGAVTLGPKGGVRYEKA